VAALKRDYYDVLGVSRDADEERIRGAFYAHAREWHPDVTETPEAEERFRELAEAYTVLSKREARLLYDRFGYRSRGSQQLDEALWETRPAEVVRGENIHTAVELRSFEAEEGTRRVVSFRAVVRCTACMGRGTVGLPDPECEHCLGTGRKRSTLQLYFADLEKFDACPVCVGESCQRCDGERRRQRRRGRFDLRRPARTRPRAAAARGSARRALRRVRAARRRNRDTGAVRRPLTIVGGRGESP